jgi:hypothetical protein
MKVSELIDILSECNADADVFIISYSDIGHCVSTAIDEDNISDECDKVFIDIA